MIESSIELGPWRECVAWRAQHANPTGMFTGAVTVRLNFILPRPKATPKRSTPPAIKRPDIDKLARACLDAITGVVITDDSLVVDLAARKRLARIGETPGVHIQVTSAAEVPSPPWNGEELWPGDNVLGAWR
jgi:crossover junction endodeoxyribonuclease RusA